VHLDLGESPPPPVTSNKHTLRCRAADDRAPARSACRDGARCSRRYATPRSAPPSYRRCRVGTHDGGQRELSGWMKFLRVFPRVDLEFIGPCSTMRSRKAAASGRPARGRPRSRGVGDDDPHVEGDFGNVVQPWAMSFVWPARGSRPTAVRSRIPIIRQRMPTNVPSRRRPIPVLHPGLGRAASRPCSPSGFDHLRGRPSSRASLAATTPRPTGAWRRKKARRWVRRRAVAPARGPAARTGPFAPCAASGRRGAR